MIMYLKYMVILPNRANTKDTMRQYTIGICHVRFPIHDKDMKGALGLSQE